MPELTKSKIKQICLRVAMDGDAWSTAAINSGVPRGQFLDWVFCGRKQPDSLEGFMVTELEKASAFHERPQPGTADKGMTTEHYHNALFYILLEKLVNAEKDRDISREHVATLQKDNVNLSAKADSLHKLVEKRLAERDELHKERDTLHKLVEVQGI